MIREESMKVQVLFFIKDLQIVLNLKSYDSAVCGHHDGKNGSFIPYTQNDEILDRPHSGSPFT